MYRSAINGLGARAGRTDLGRASGSKCPTSRIDFLPFSTTFRSRWSVLRRFRWRARKDDSR